MQGSLVYLENLTSRRQNGPLIHPEPMTPIIAPKGDMVNSTFIFNTNGSSHSHRFAELRFLSILKENRKVWYFTESLMKGKRVSL